MIELAQTAAQGVRLATLEALRDRLARDIDLTGSARDLASLSARLVDVLEQIDDLTPLEEENDELADLVVLPGAG